MDYKYYNFDFKKKLPPATNMQLYRVNEVISRIPIYYKMVIVWAG